MDYTTPNSYGCRECVTCSTCSTVRGYWVRWDSDLVPMSPLEKWSPHEVVVFEAAICVYGKDFYQISKAIKTKTTKEVIEFYYSWKFSSHYYSWRAHYRSPFEDYITKAG